MFEHLLQNCRKRMSWKLCVDFKRATLEISSQEAGRAEHSKITWLPRKTPRQGKVKICLNKLSLWLKRMILGSKKMFYYFEFGFIVLAVLKCLFRHNSCRRSLTHAEKLPLFTHFCSNQRFF